MNKFINIIMLLLIVLFFFGITNYYLSNKNININNYNRTNIEKIQKKKILDLPVLVSDTNNVIEFNNSIVNDIKNEKKRSFWDLLKIK